MDSMDMDNEQPKSASAPLHQAQKTAIKIVSATYGPADRRRLLTGEPSSSESASAPYTRDVAPFLRVLLMHENENEEQNSEGETDDDGLASTIPISFIPLMDGKSMNAIFGDPCPGTSKRLKVHYVVYESAGAATCRAATSEVHRVTFSEHERVVLRRRVTFYQDESTLKNAVAAVARKSNQACDDNEKHDSTLRKARMMGRAQSIAEFAAVTAGLDNNGGSPMNSNGTFYKAPQTNLQQEKPKTRLRSATSEIVLPMILQFLDLRERVNCQLVCKVWRIVIRRWGVAQTVDVNDRSFPNFTRAFLRGIMSHSYSSLHSLFLNDFKQLRKEDLHPAIPHLRKIRSLDVSRCDQLDDSTLQLISEHTSNSLKVFYMKGLRKVTDAGLISICRACKKLQVLEISHVKITDQSGVAIGENLTQLRALYMRDNYLLTNRSVDVITEKCTRLAQLTLWGCTRLRHLSFEGLDQTMGCGNLVLLNLWGCHSLRDETANALGPMSKLRSLIVSECHQLSDGFLVGLAENVPKLMHLHLRYCKKITDKGINAITNTMQSLYSLDLGFCTRISGASIFSLLEIRYGTLSELRLQNCHQLDIASTQQQANNGGGGDTGRSILAALRANDGGSSLCILDVRNCGGHPSASDNYPLDDPFCVGMQSLEFRQTCPGFFVRPARDFKPKVREHLLGELVSNSPTERIRQGE